MSRTYYSIEPSFSSLYPYRVTSPLKKPTPPQVKPLIKRQMQSRLHTNKLYAFTIAMSSQHSSCLALRSSISCSNSTRLYPAFTSALFTQTNFNKLCYSYKMDRRIAGFHQDEESFWVAELECGHQQHVRHNPPMTLRPWVKECFYRC